MLFRRTISHHSVEIRLQKALKDLWILWFSTKDKKSWQDYEKLHDKHHCLKKGEGRLLRTMFLICWPELAITDS